MRLALLLLSLAAAPDRAETEVEAQVSEDLESLAFTVRTRFIPGEPLDQIAISAFADRFKQPPEGMLPTAIRQLYPASFSKGGFEGLRIEINGNPCTAAPEPGPHEGSLRTCEVQAEPGVPVTLEITGHLLIPTKYGAFGGQGRVVTLGGGWFPRAVRPGPRPMPPKGTLRIKLTAPSELAVLIGDRWFPVRDATDPRTVEARFTDVVDAGLMLRPASVLALPAAGGQARYLVGPASKLRDPAGRPIEVEEVLAALTDGLRFLGEEGFPPPSRPLVAVEAPLRHELAVATEHAVLISDHAFRMAPLDRFLKFHRLPILRELFLERLLAQLPDEAPGDRVLAADAIASWLLDRYVASRFGHGENAFDVIGVVGFIPAVDSMLYAPDLPFVGAYFRLIKEDDPLREEVLDHPRLFPRGKLLYEKLRDRLGPRGVSALLAAILAGRSGRFLDAVRAALPDGQAFLDTWLGSYPELRYRLGEYGPVPGGAKAEIHREGTPASEPVEVLFTDEDGNERLVVAPASDQPLRVVTATLAAPFSSVTLDPYGRLAETPSEDNPSPHFLHKSDPSWKILLNNFNLLFSQTSSATLDTAIDLGFSRPYDVHWAYAIRGDYHPDAISISGRARYAFGDRVTAARLANWIGLTVEGDYLRPGYANEKLSGLAINTALSYGFDDRTSLWAPEPGRAFRITADYNHVFGELPADQALTRDAVALTASGVAQWMPGLGTMLAIKGSAGGYVFGEPRKQLKYGIGGRYNVRGYAQDAVVAKFRGTFGAELTHPILPDWSFNGLYFAWLTGIDGGLFGDLAAIGDSFEEIKQRGVLADVGYGLRVYLDYFGVRPGVMAIEVALPLTGTAPGAKLGPPTFYIDFSQSFAVF